MQNVIRIPLTLVGFSLVLAGNVLTQQLDDDPQRMTLTGLRTFAVYARVQLTQPATLQAIDETLLRAKMELALRREGISVVGRNDVRDGSGAHISLLYLVMETRDKAGQAIGFAASSCLQAAQTVSVPRLSVGGRLAYTVVPTWRSCGLLAGGTDSYTNTILQNTDEQIARFLNAWRIVNPPRPAPPVPSTPELGISVGRGP
jgi:hypothetical protein